MLPPHPTRRGHHLELRNTLKIKTFHLLQSLDKAFVFSDFEHLREILEQVGKEYKVQHTPAVKSRAR